MTTPNQAPNIQAPEFQELDLLVNQYLDNQHALVILKREYDERKAQADRAFRESEQALVDYMQGNGLAKDLTSDKRFSVSLGISTTTEVTCDINELPERFIRIKKEVNKVAINEAVKVGEKFNWLEKRQSLKLTVK